jgi:excisionase family DNA binding protein
MARTAPQPPPTVGPEPLLTVSEVAELFRVNARTVKRWAKTRRVTAIRTPGGHHRYPAAQIYALLEANTDTH